MTPATCATRFLRKALLSHGQALLADAQGGMVHIEQLLGGKEQLLRICCIVIGNTGNT